MRHELKDVHRQSKVAYTEVLHSQTYFIDLIKNQFLPFALVVGSSWCS